ncbi:MAG TPA: FHA domain-containing protein [Blastocatellia bacterium]|jgi:soluble lytic murein transglycosylase-like protein|nr:FHA domain-containing protein [Blastocatellia bacterium]
MAEVTLTIKSPDGARRVLLSGSRLTVGRGENAELCIEDRGLSRLHASIHREGDKVWVVDDGSTNGTFVNGASVPDAGTLLADGDELRLGDNTLISVGILENGQDGAAPQSDASSPNFRLILSVALVGAFIISLAAVIGSRLLTTQAETSDTAVKKSEAAPKNSATPPGPPGEGAELSSGPSANRSGEDAGPVPPGDSNSLASQATQPPAAPLSSEPARLKLYKDMTDKERLEFIDRSAQVITVKMSNSARSEVFDEFVLLQIKRWADSYSRSRSKTGLWGVDIGVIFNRAINYAPYISRCFNQQEVPAIVGLYIVWIETAYVNVNYENKAHAMGLFQFIPGTAVMYGVDPSERTNVEKMAPAAARYMKDRIARFGGDTKGVALAIANYNRGGTPADLRKIIDAENPDRSFWTLMANKEKLNHYFQNENVDYVPRFFAAAIIGENPRVFGVQMNPLSSYVVEPGK